MTSLWKVTVKTRRRQKTERVKARKSTTAMKAFKKLHPRLWQEDVRYIRATKIKSR